MEPIMEYSVVVPLKNEEENIHALVAEIEPVMQALKQPWELIAIDDGSTDGTKAAILSLKKQKPFLRLISFDKNYGQTSAFDAGFRSAKGKIIITLDGDLQNDPKDIPLLLEKMKDHDLVVGWRHQRKDPISKKITSKLANWVRGSFCSDGVKDTGCSLKAYRKSCFDKIKLYHGMHRFLPALFAMEGFRITQVPVNHRERTKGQTKYNFFNRSFNTVADMLAVRWMQSRRLRYQIKEDL